MVYTETWEYYVFTPMTKLYYYIHISGSIKKFIIGTAATNELLGRNETVNIT